MMLMPCWPRAGPTGGAGDAWPPAAWSLIVVRTFFAMAFFDGTRYGWRAADGWDQIFLTWSKPTSTGVSRPKIDTRTLSFEASWLISEISPEKSDSGPETTLTDSPIENWALVATFCATSRCSR